MYEERVCVTITSAQTSWDGIIMCAIFGALLHPLTGKSVDEANYILNHIIRASIERGRDGIGLHTWEGKSTLLWKSNDKQDTNFYQDTDYFWGNKYETSICIGNLRAEPTTEYVKKKSRDDQQPYSVSNWTVVHNGTIANDKELRTGKVPTKIDSAAIPEILDGADGFLNFQYSIPTLKGSYAILAHDLENPNTIYWACNYRPIWYITTPLGMFFASSRNYFPWQYEPVMIDPYTIGCFVASNGEIHSVKCTLIALVTPPKALVVCSGGLDSVVAAKVAQSRLGMDVTLIHFLYGSRAQAPEVEAIKKIAAELDVELVLFPLPVYSKKDSPLLDADSKVAGGEEGAEFAHEWVPARNLVMLSVATAYAEANGFDHIVLGNNLEEAGAYPDNEPEFIHRFNDMLPFAVGDGKSVKVIMPVGNLMKHEIVKLGLEIGAPLHLTWSCYRAGQLHCGKCGPCYMRRTAFQINNADEVIEYE